MRILPLLLLLCLAGCVRIPTDEAAAQILPSPSIKNSEALALESDAFEQGAFPSESWWKMFEDEQLGYLIERALSCNPTLMAAKARIDQAEAEAKIRRSRLFPTVALETKLNWQYFGENDFFRAFAPTFPGYIPEYEIDLNFSYELDFWGKNRNLYQAAIGYQMAAFAELAHARLILSCAVAATYFKLQAHLQTLALLEKQRELLTKQLELTKGRFDAALDNETDLLHSNDRLFALNQSIAHAQMSVALSRHTLNQLLGQGPDCRELIDSIQRAPEKAFPLPSRIDCDLLARRPDLMAQIWRVEAAAHLVGAAKANFYPNVNLFALAGFDSVFFSKWFRWESRTGSIGPAIHLPIFTAGRIKAHLKKRRAEFEEAIDVYNQMILLAAKEVADQIITLKTADETLELENHLIENQVHTTKLARERYENALDNLLQFLNVRESLLTESMRQIRYSYEKKLAMVQLIQALGGGYCNSENPIGGEM